MIYCECSHCRTAYEAGDDHVGQTFTCGVCGQPFTIPDATAQIIADPGSPVQPVAETIDVPGAPDLPPASLPTMEDTANPFQSEPVETPAPAPSLQRPPALNVAAEPIPLPPVGVVAAPPPVLHIAAHAIPLPSFPITQTPSPAPEHSAAAETVPAAPQSPAPVTVRKVVIKPHVPVAATQPVATPVAPPAATEPEPGPAAVQPPLTLPTPKPGAFRTAVTAAPPTGSVRTAVTAVTAVQQERTESKNLKAAKRTFRTDKSRPRVGLVFLGIIGSIAAALLLLLPGSPYCIRKATVSTPGAVMNNKPVSPEAPIPQASTGNPSNTPALTVSEISTNLILTDATSSPDTTPPTDSSGNKAEIKSGLMEEDIGGSKWKAGYTPGGSGAPQQGERKINPDRLAEFLKILAREKYQPNRIVTEAYYKFQIAETQDDLKQMGKPLPDDFLKWVNDDPIVRASVYVAKPRPANVLLMLYSLQLDVGKETIHKCTQLALAAAILNEQQGPAANITPHPPVKLEIPPCPLQPVDTRDPKRQLDVNDHIINFLNEDYRLCTKDSALKKYRHHDGDPCVSPFRFKKGLLPESKGLIASDVIKDDDLKDLLSDYLTSKGTPLEIPHGKLQSPATVVNFETFHKAYVEKGLLPADRDPMPTTSERLIFLAQHAERAPFPVTRAPWPLSIILFEVQQPLRESEEIYTEYATKKRFITYGNYVGPIAQNAIYLAASDLRPFPFSCKTRSWQAMIKNGGVCGTMAAIAVGTYNALGIPAVTAGQPGHCALLSYTAAGNTYRANIEQSVTGGPDETTIHLPFPFGDGKYGSNMFVYRESIATAMNIGFSRYLESCMMYSIYRLLPNDVREQHGFEVLQNGLDLNPYNIMIVDALSEIGSPIQHTELYKRFIAHTSSNRKPGFQLSEVYRDKLCHIVFSRIAAAPMPTSKDELKTVFNFLRSISFNSKELELLDQLELITLNYQAAAHDTKTFLAEMMDEFSNHFDNGKQRHPTICQKEAKRLKIVMDKIQEEDQKKEWLKKLAAKIAGREDYTALGRLQVDKFEKDSNKPRNFRPGPGQLTLNDGLGNTLKVHFVLGSSTLDGYNGIRDEYQDYIPKGYGANTALKPPPYRQPSSSQHTEATPRRQAASTPPRQIAATPRPATSPHRQPNNVERPPSEVEKPERLVRLTFAPTILRDETADLVNELLGNPKKPAHGLGAMLTEEALKDRKEAADVLHFLHKSMFEDPVVILRYSMAAEGEDKFLAEQVEQFKKYAAGSRNELTARKQARVIESIAGMVQDSQKKTEWLKKMQVVIKGKETYAARQCLKTTDEYGNELPVEKQITLVSCAQTSFDDEAATAINSLLGGEPTPTSAEKTADAPKPRGKSKVL